jgi:hypothetical protein
VRECGRDSHALGSECCSQVYGSTSPRLCWVGAVSPPSKYRSHSAKLWHSCPEVEAPRWMRCLGEAGRAGGLEAVLSPGTVSTVRSVMFRERSKPVLAGSSAPEALGGVLLTVSPPPRQKVASGGTRRRPAVAPSPWSRACRRPARALGLRTQQLWCWPWKEWCCCGMRSCNMNV